MSELLGERGYLALLKDILQTGQRVENDRTGVGTLSVFGRQMRFDLSLGFPLLTTKKLFTKAIVHELLWFLQGDTNIKYLKDNGVSIWDEWADEDGELGPVYGRQWRSWPNDDIRYGHNGVEIVHGAIDQISNVMASLANNPRSRRHIVSAWNPAEVDDMKLPPCHCLFQFYVREVPQGERRHLAAMKNVYPVDSQLDVFVPRYYLDCQLYQRSDNERLH